MNKRSLKVYLVLGEESGDKLGADLAPALKRQAQEAGTDVEFVGLAGPRLKEQGVQSLFNIEDIAVMGFTAVITRLPTIVRRVYQTVADIKKQKPDVIVLIDSPDFTHAVAKRVKKRLPDVPVINYICPSVWAWRPGRAKKMRAYIDHVLAILPFEPKALEDLGGPPGTYIGHPLARQIAALPAAKRPKPDNRLLVLPGSRRGEIKRMLALYGETLTILKDRGVDFQPVLPAVTRLADTIKEQTASWPVQPTFVDSSENAQSFAGARAALATSGTVVLELALHRVPTIVCYRLDSIARMLSSLITVWTGLLPNLILDRVFVPEEHNEMVKPHRLARYLERLMDDTLERQVQLEGFEELTKAMETKRPPGELAAEIVLDHIK